MYCLFLAFVINVVDFTFVVTLVSHPTKMNGDLSLYGYKGTEAVYVYNSFLHNVEKPTFQHHQTHKVL